MLVLYMHLLIITCLHNKAAVIIKMLVKSICLGVHFDSLTANFNSRCINNVTDYASDTFPTSLSTEVSHLAIRQKLAKQ